MGPTAINIALGTRASTDEISSRVRHWNHVNRSRPKRSAQSNSDEYRIKNWDQNESNFSHQRVNRFVTKYTKSLFSGAMN